jgi:hypothetical protein
METSAPGNYVEIIDQKIELEGITLLHLNEIRKWTHFLSILGFVAVGLLFFVGILLLVTTTLRSAVQFDQYSLLTPWIGIFYIVFAAIYFFPVFYLLKFSILARHSLMRIGSGESSSGLMADAIHYLKRHFRFIGISTIVMLVVYLLVIIGLVIAFAIR